MAKGKNKVEVYYFNFPRGIKSKLVKNFVNFTLDFLKMRKGFLNIIFMPTLRTLNRKFLNRNKDANVIVFPWKEKLYEKGEVFLGEIYIGMKRAKLEKKRTLTEQIIVLLSHALLHLKGYSDKTEEENVRMQMISDKVIKLWKKGV